MPGFSDRRAMLRDAAFAAFGEDAIWPGIAGTVRVRLLPGEVEQPIVNMRTIVNSIVMTVRESDVTEPSFGDLPVIADGLHAGTYRVIAEPTVDRKRVWTCEVERVA